MELSAEIKKHLQALQELGITEISREIETLAERSLFLPSAEAAEAWAITTTVLSYTGMGEFDSAMRRWSPSSFSVYSFDPEALDPRRMYTFFLQGLSAISRSEFSITEAAEYDADGEEAHMIRFQKNGRPYEYVAQSGGDWFDLRILNFINSIQEKENCRHRFFFLVSGCQMIVVFYNTPEWAEAFTAKLGYPLYSAVDF